MSLRRLPLAVAAIVAAALLPVPVAAAAPGTAARLAPAYRNPLSLRLPGGEQAASCADPDVLRPSGADRHWYLYCTSDALRADELGADGTPLIHNVPMFRSLDLVHWRYVGDAFATKPSWVSGFLWAPDVVHHAGHYLMYYAASDTSLPGGGSAVGVATSDSPAGPWTDAGAPVVAPTMHPNGSGARWEFDPDVIYTGGHAYLYFGSYFGGVYARELTADGLSSLASTETQIAIDNRYEGTFVVRHNGWYYFMGSATNCCNGSLTGYAVFAARSRSPLGPFLDRDGRSILDPRVGGTPVLVQNGNRWVGTGHNAVLRDYSGQEWILYHAVDRKHPYYAGDVGYTKRPALLDPLDWRAGWPTVRGGAGPSARPLPGPAAQPGERTAYHPHWVRDARPAKPDRTLSDGFSGTALSDRWTWVRPDQADYSVSSGTLQWHTQNADLHPESGGALASVLSERAPRGRYVVETKVRVDFPTDATCCQNYAQGGLVIYGDDGNYVKLASVSIWDTRQTEFGKEITPQPTGYPNYGNTVVGPVGDWTYLRIVHIGDRYTAYTSLDGRHWDRGGTWTHHLGAHPRIGLVSMGAAGYTSSFDYVRVSRLR